LKHFFGDLIQIRWHGQIDSDAVVPPSASIGPGSVLGPGVVLGENVSIGPNTVLANVSGARTPILEPTALLVSQALATSDQPMASFTDFRISEMLVSEPMSRLGQTPA
jgi:hypothetical protein